MKPEEIRPTYYTEYDEVGKTWCIYITEYQDHIFDVFIAEFEDSITAMSICDCMNDVMMRLWNG